MNNKIYTLACLMLASASAMAQMDNTVEVETSVTPVVKDANKINVLPEVVESTAKHNEVNYSTTMLQTKKYVFSPVDILSSEDGGKGAGKGFVSLGAGLPGILDLKGAYGFNLSKNDVLGFRVSCGGYNGKAGNKDFGTDKAVQGFDYKSRFYTTRGGVDYAHKYAKGLSEFFIKAGYESQVFNYQWPMSYAKDDAVMHVNPMDKQNNSLGGISLGTTDYKSKNFRINGELGFDFFNQKYVTNLQEKNSESMLHLKTDLGFYFNEENSVNADIEFVNTTYGMKLDNVEGYSHLRVTPYYKYEDYDFMLKAGIFIGGSGIAPDVRFEYHISEYVDFYANATGGEEETTLKSLCAISPYAFVQSYQTFEPTFHQIDGNLGIRFRGDSGWAGDFNLGYDKTNDRAELSPMFVRNDGYAKKNGKATGSQDLYYMFTDGGRFYVNFDLKYNHKDKVKFDLKNQFNAWSIDKDDKDYIAIARPTIDLDWNIDFRFCQGFYMGVDWKLQSFKKSDADTSIKIPNTEAYKRPTTCDFGISAHYAFQNFPLSIFANVDNLFNCKYDKFYGYRAPGTNFIVGAAVTF